MTRLAAPSQCSRDRTGWDRLASFVADPLAPLYRLVSGDPASAAELRPIVRHACDARMTCEPVYEDDGTGTVVAMHVGASGDLSDQARVKALYRLVNRLFDAHPPRVVVDLTDAEAMDTKAIGCLVVLHRRALLDRIEFRVRCSDTMRRWLNVCRINSIIEMTG